MIEDCEHENVMFEPSGRLICELCRNAMYPQPKPYKDDPGFRLSFVDMIDQENVYVELSHDVICTLKNEPIKVSRRMLIKRDKFKTIEQAKQWIYLQILHLEKHEIKEHLKFYDRHYIDSHPELNMKI